MDHVPLRGVLCKLQSSFKWRVHIHNHNVCINIYRRPQETHERHPCGVHQLAHIEGDFIRARLFVNISVNTSSPSPFLFFYESGNMFKELSYK